MTLILILVSLLSAVVIFVFIQPQNFTITRSRIIPAPANVLFERVNNLHYWNNWSPWAKLDPNAKNTFSGPDAGMDATLSWQGNNKVGSGSMVITQSKPDDFIHLRLDFLKPMKATNIAQFTFQPEGNQTKVTWTMSGKNNFIGKLFNLLVNCDKMVGKQFEEGLANLQENVMGLAQ